MLADSYVGGSGPDNLTVANYILALGDRAKRNLVTSRYGITYLDEQVTDRGASARIEVNGRGCDVVALIENYQLHQVDANKMRAQGKDVNVKGSSGKLATTSTCRCWGK